MESRWEAAKMETQTEFIPVEPIIDPKTRAVARVARGLLGVLDLLMGLAAIAGLVLLLDWAVEGMR